MKLVHPNIESQFIFGDKVNVLCVENGKQFRDFLEDFHAQIGGFNGKFVLSEGEKIFDFTKTVVVLTDFYALDFAEKKLQNKLYTKLQAILDENFQTDFAEFSEKFYNLLAKLNAESPFAIDSSETPSVANIFKCFGVCFSYDENSFIDKICKFAEILTNLLGIKLIVFVNLKSYLSEKEFALVKEFFVYNKINVLLLENAFKNSGENEFSVIIDADLCEIIA